MKTKNVLKKFLGGGVALALALGIFAGTGMDVRAEAENQRFEWKQLDSKGDSWQQFLGENVFITLDNTNITGDFEALRRSMEAGNLYIFGSEGERGLYYGALPATAYYVTEANYDVLKSTYTDWYILKEKNSLPGGSTTPIDVSGSGTDSSTYSHTHAYSWVTVQEANVGQDGIEEYRCSCGDVQGRSVIPASATIVDGFCNAVKNVPVDGIAEYDSGWWHTMSDYFIRELAKRPDVTTVITFEYERQMYKMTIPAGVDYTTLLADEDYFYGYFYFANAVGATIETIKTTQ